MSGSDEIRRVTYYVVSGFETAAPVAATVGTHLPFDGKPTTKTDGTLIPGNLTRKDGFASRSRRGVRFGSITGKVPFYTGNLAADGSGGDAAPGQAFLERLFESHFGANATFFAGTTVDATSVGAGKTAVVKLVASPPLGMTLIFAGNGTTDEPEVGTVVGVTGAGPYDVTLNRDISTAACYAAAGKVYGGWLFQAPSSPAEYTDYVYMLVEYADRTVLFGPMQVTKMGMDNINAREGLQVSLECDADNWDTGYTPVFSGFANDNGFVAQNPLIAVGAPFYIEGSDGVLAETPISSVSVDFGIQRSKRKATAGPRGVDAYKVTNSKPTIKFSEYFNVQRRTDWEEGTARQCLLWVPPVSTTGLGKGRGGMALYAPQVEFKHADQAIDGMDGQAIDGMVIGPTVAQAALGLTSALYLTLHGGITGAPA